MHSFSTRPARHSRTLAAALTLWMGSTAAPADDSWRVGSELRRELDVARSITWSDNPLRAGIERLARESRVAMYLDRRVDPDQRVSVSTASLPLAQLLGTLADQVGVGVGRIDAVFYFGPAEEVIKLEALAELKQTQLDQTPADVRRAMGHVTAWSWPDLTTPQQLLARFTDETGVRLEGLEQIPHDLWPAASLPPLAARDRLSLLLAGFGLTYEPAGDGRSMKLVPIPPRLVVTRSYSIKLTTTEFRELQSQFPEATLRRGATSLTVDGTAVDHHRLARHLASLRPAETSRPGGTTAYTLKVEQQPVGAIIQTIAQKAGLQIELDPRVRREQLEERVTIEVQDASLEALLRQVLGPANLTFRQSGKTLTLLPSD